MTRNNPDSGTLDAIHETRAEMFRPAWIGRLIAGRLPLGETFWGGHLGMQLVFMPLWLLLVVVVPAAIPLAAWGAWMLFFGLQFLWVMAVTQAVIRVAPGAKSVGIWRWLAIAVALMLAAQAIWLLRQFFTDPAMLGLG